MIQELRRIEMRQIVFNASLLFQQRTHDVARPSVLDNLDEEPIRHPADTHPRIRERLTSLAVTLEQIQKSVLDVRPAEAAIDLINNHEAVETGLTPRLQTLLA